MKKKFKLLIIYNPAASHVSTTFEYTSSFKEHSKFDIYYIDIEYINESPRNLDDFDAIWINYCVRMNDKNLITDSFVRSLSSYAGTVLVAIQDEYELTDAIRESLNKIGATIVLTCVPQKYVNYVYPKAQFRSVQFETVLTGYVPARFEGQRPQFDYGNRPIAVGYRGRRLPRNFGTLGREKWEIGTRVADACQRLGIVHDIAVDEASRIYGPAWLDFIKSCRAMLGSASGSNVFDFDGSIAAEVAGLPGTDGDLPEGLAGRIAAREREIDMGQISPRVFEAAACGTALILIRGQYSGALVADEHYVPIEPDFSNVDEALGKIADISALEAMAQRTYDHLIASGTYGYKSFITRMDRIIEDSMSRNTKRRIESSIPALDESILTRIPQGHSKFVLNILNNLRQKNDENDRLMIELSRYGSELNKLGEKYNNDTDLLKIHLHRTKDDLSKLMEQIHNNPRMLLKLLLDHAVKFATGKK